MNFYLFSAGGLSKLKAGDYVPDLSEVTGVKELRDLRPRVLEIYPTTINGFALYQGTRFIHTVKESGANLEGIILELTDPQLDRWQGLLDKFEESYGLKKAELHFKITTGQIKAS